jgi:integrase
MPLAGKGPRLWLRPARRDKRGRVTHPAVYVIRDGSYQRSTGCGGADLRQAEAALREYLAEKHIAATTKSTRHPARIPIVDVLALYARNIAPKHSRPHETQQRIHRLLVFWGSDMLSVVNGDRCRAYARSRSTDAAARRELEELRAAINHHRREGYCSEIVEVVLPERRPHRERWMTRAEAARLIWTAWRYWEIQKGVPTDRRSRRHVARFILVGLYTGTRAGAVCAAALQPTVGRGWVDLERGVFYRRPTGVRETKTRRPPVPLPNRLLAHLRRWKRHGQRFAVEWNGDPVKDVDKAFRSTANEARLPDVTPHVLRHTAATWLMQLGTDKWEAAEYLGMTAKMLDEVYGHHHPDHLKGPRAAFDRSPQARHKIPATDREQTPSNVRKLLIVQGRVGGPCCSGRGGRRFKSCHSDQFFRVSRSLPGSIAVSGRSRIVRRCRGRVLLRIGIFLQYGIGNNRSAGRRIPACAASAG